MKNNKYDNMLFKHKTKVINADFKYKIKSKIYWKSILKQYFPLIIIVLLAIFILCWKNVTNKVIKEQLPVIENKYSIFSYNKIPFLDNNIDTTIEILNKHQITDVFLTMKSYDFEFGIEYEHNYDFYREKVGKLRHNAINTYLLYDSYVIMDDEITNVINYNKKIIRESQLIKGVAFNFSSLILDDYMENPVFEFKNLYNELKNNYNYAKNNGIEFILLISDFDEEIYLKDIDIKLEEKEEIKSYIQSIYKQCDKLIIKNYDKNNMIKNIENKYIHNKNIINLTNIDVDNDINNTYNMHDNPFDDVKNKWDELLTYYPNINFGYNSLNGLLELNNINENITFTLEDIDGNNLDEEDMIIYIKINYYYFVVLNHNISLPKDIEYKVNAIGYDIHNMEKTSLDNNKYNVKLILKKQDF
ncbi:MAG: hypothetical protein PUA90_03225 [bacterium]|nr:hypothetical protein [bacterium]